MTGALSVIAARASVEALADAIFEQHPHWPQRDASFFRHGAWAVFVARGYQRIAFLPTLEAVCRAVGPLLIVSADYDSGRAMYQYFEQGALRREIANWDGPVEVIGAARPEERAVDISDFGIAEAWALWRAYGLPEPSTRSDIEPYPLLGDEDE